MLVLKLSGIQIFIKANCGLNVNGGKKVCTRFLLVPVKNILYMVSECMWGVGRVASKYQTFMRR